MTDPQNDLDRDSLLGVEDKQQFDVIKLLSICGAILTSSTTGLVESEPQSALLADVAQLFGAPDAELQLFFFSLVSPSTLRCCFSGFTVMDLAWSCDLVVGWPDLCLVGRTLELLVSVEEKKN